MKAKQHKSGKVHSVKTVQDRRTNRALEQALKHPEKVEDWDEIDFTNQENFTHKHDLE